MTPDGQCWLTLPHSVRTTLRGNYTTQGTEGPRRAKAKDYAGALEYIEKSGFYSSNEDIEKVAGHVSNLKYLEDKA